MAFCHALRHGLKGGIFLIAKACYHSALQFVTPGQRHRGEAEAIVAQRQAVYEAAKQRHPERRSGNTRDWTLPRVVWLNPAKPEQRPPANDPALKVAS